MKPAPPVTSARRILRSGVPGGVGLFELDIKLGSLPELARWLVSRQMPPPSNCASRSLVRTRTRERQRKYPPCIRFAPAERLQRPWRPCALDPVASTKAPP